MDWNFIYNTKDSLSARFNGYDHPSKGVPHSKQWSALQRHLKKCGVKVGVNPHFSKSEWKCISPTHRMGRAKGIVLLLDTTPLGITVNIGHEKNLVNNGLMVWPQYHSEYTPLTFLERMAFNWAYNKVADFFKSLGLQMKKHDSDMGPEEFILNKEAANTHIHGGPTTLLGIKEYITEDNHNWHYNSDDANKKKIVCRDNKCFYEGGNLHQGVAWHNINNMWWVICGNQLHNVASFYLFDYKEGTPRRKPADANKMERLLKKFEAARDYKRCIVIQGIIEKMSKKDEPRETIPA